MYKIKVILKDKKTGENLLYVGAEQTLEECFEYIKAFETTGAMICFSCSRINAKQKPEGRC